VRMHRWKGMTRSGLGKCWTEVVETGPHSDDAGAEDGIEGDVQDSGGGMFFNCGAGAGRAGSA
jgi:hypothetical protein